MPLTKRHSRSWRQWTIAAGLAVVVHALPAHAQRLGYTIIPSAQRVQWDDGLAFDDDYVYGGRLGLLFGPYVELQPFYYMRSKFPFDSTRASTLFGPNAARRTVDVRYFGSNLQFNLGHGDFIPFARVGGGIIQFKPDSGKKQERIAITGGGGVRFALGGLQAELFAEQLAFRLNPRRLFGDDSVTVGTAPSHRNMSYGAAITLPLSAMGEPTTGEGLRGASAPLEPFVGRLRYNGKHRLEDQDLAGLRAGVDFSSLFGIRGFYWRGINDDRDGTEPVAGYGGEAQFNLNTGPGLSPYLVVGAGRIDYLGGFKDTTGMSREDQTALILGGGVSFRLTDRVRLNASIRDYVMTLDDQLENVSTTDDLTHNTLISGGFTISLGGRSTSGDLQDARTARQRAEATARLERARREDLLKAERGDSLAMRRLALREDSLRAAGDSMRTRRDLAPMQGKPGMRMQPGDSTRWVMIPVPTVGEVILRYGTTPSTERSALPAGMTIDDLRRLIRAEVRGDTTTPLLDSRTTILRDDSVSQRLRAMENRLQAQTDSLREERLRLAREVPAAPAPSTVIVTAEGETRPLTTSGLARLGSVSSRELQPFVGLSFGDDETQFVASVRADLGPLSKGSGFHLVPEFALGFGGGYSLLAMANLQYSFTSFGTRAIRPYVTGGAGIFTPSVLGLNTAVGTSFNLRGGRGTPLYGYAEVQGINLFDHTRVMIGLSSGR